MIILRAHLPTGFLAGVHRCDLFISLSPIGVMVDRCVDRGAIYRLHRHWTKVCFYLLIDSGHYCAMMTNKWYKLVLLMIPVQAIFTLLGLPSSVFWVIPSFLCCPTCMQTHGLCIELGSWMVSVWSQIQSLRGGRHCSVTLVPAGELVLQTKRTWTERHVSTVLLNRQSARVQLSFWPSSRARQTAMTAEIQSSSRDVQHTV